MVSANDTLQNVFAACEKEPNIIPFDKIILRRKANTRSDRLCKYAIIFMIILLLIIPFLAIRVDAKIETEVNSSSIHIIEHYVRDHAIHLMLENDNYYFPSCYSLDAKGVRHLPIIDSASPNHIVFPYTGVEINLYLCDEYGEYLHLIVTPNK